MAAVANTKAQLAKSLAGAGKYYLAAAHLMGLENPSAIYHYCSYIQLSILRAKNKAEATQLIKDGLQEDPLAYFARWTKEADYLAGERGSPYAGLRGANLQLTQTL